MARHVFYSFHFIPDVMRVSQVRGIGSLEANRPAHDNDWHTVTSGKDTAIKRWILDQRHGRSCTVVLVGQDTANRKWINHEIVESWNKCMGVGGIRIHGLKNMKGEISNMGGNPFDYITLGKMGTKMSSIVKCYNPPDGDSKERYTWISQYLLLAVEEAIRIRNAS